MTNADIQYQKVIRLLQGMDKRLIKIEETLLNRPPKKILTPTKVNAAE